ncbi:MAG: hypothetical protein ACREJN_21225 [Nitrospiraceae bacterium]
METIIRPSTSAVVPSLEQYETLIGSRDPDISPLLALVGTTPERQVLVRFTPSIEQRRAILGGDDIFLSVLTFGQPFHPIMMFVSPELDEAVVVETLQLPAV